MSDAMQKHVQQQQQKRETDVWLHGRVVFLTKETAISGQQISQDSPKTKLLLLTCFSLSLTLTPLRSLVSPRVS